MTSVDSITPKELLELASLDALGLLDEFEARIYTRVFYGAPATVQDQVVRLQAEITEDLSLLPGEEPDPMLRERVLKAVAKAVEHNDAALAPIARIGRGSAPHVDHAREPRTAMYWRAASFVLAGASLLLAYFLALGYRSSSELAVAALSQEATILAEKLGVRTQDFMTDASIKEPLFWVPVDDREMDEKAPPPCGALFLNEDKGQIFVLVDGLPKDVEYFLQIQRKDGERPQRIQSFKSLGGLTANLVEGIAVSQLVTAAFKWEIATASGEVLLRSA